MSGPEDGPVVLAQGGFKTLSELRGTLAGAGIEAQIVNPPGSSANT